ncbi:MAG: flavin-containing monooxygenase [Phormidesmis sp.]
MNVAIVGAGFAGLSTAKILKSCGHRVTIFEKESDLGGVWSASRRYPGLTTQNVRSTYALSDFPYPTDYPEWPSGEQVQQYLEEYASHFGLYDNLRLETKVTSAVLDETAQSWENARVHADATATETFDYLVVCNGIFSQPALPDFEGAEAFIHRGGKVIHSSEFHEVESLRVHSPPLCGVKWQDE